MGTLILDASVLIGLLDTADPHHPAAVDDVEAADRSGAALKAPASAYSGALVAFARADRVTDARDAIAAMGITITPLTGAIAERAAALRAEHERLRLPDALVLATARHLGAELLTYDDRLSRIAAAGGSVQIRDGRPTDDAALLTMWDKAIAWMVSRGQAKQWGTEPASEQPQRREQVEEWVRGRGLRIAELHGRPVGASVIVATPPAHVPASPRRETYLLFLISDRDQAGKGIGSDLVRRAAADARAAGSEILRVDCWAGAPDLVAWYERQGFVRSDTFKVDVRGGWDGQVFEMAL